METIGCRLNQYETERIAADLNRRGWTRAAFGDNADLYIINTCTVTGRADASSRNIISRAARSIGHAPVVVIGCYVDAEPEKVARLNGVDLVLKNAEKENAVEILSRSFPDLFDSDTEMPGQEVIDDFYRHNRAWIKIGDGCNQRCAYCIIPKVRGPITNRPSDEIIREIQTLSDAGFYETVLTGVHIGKYKTGETNSLARLLRRMVDETDMYRIRLSSIEPQEITDDLIKVIAESGKRICRHLHVPMQAGSDRILKTMKRPYNIGQYLKKLEKIRNKIDRVMIGADIIVGFPGETDEDFADSVKASGAGLIDYLHVFSYSDRPGTAASKIPEKVNPEIIKKRNRILRELSDKCHAEAMKSELGKTTEAISEHRTDKEDREYYGITDNYLRIRMPKEAGGGKYIVRLKVTGTSGNYLVGERV